MAVMMANVLLIHLQFLPPAPTGHRNAAHLGSCGGLDSLRLRGHYGLCGLVATLQGPHAESEMV